MTNTDRELIKASFGKILEDELIDEIISTAEIREFETGDYLIDFNQYVKRIPLLLEGVIKVVREDMDEGGLVLYFLEGGETCAMTMSCCMGHKKSEVRAVAEAAGKVAMVPVSKMEEWMAKYHSWRAYVIENYNNRFNELLTAVDGLAFMKMDERLENYLRETAKVTNAKTVSKTHQEIANELNTSRVVVSRLLKTLENKGMIKLNRSSIELLN